MSAESTQSPRATLPHKASRKSSKAALAALPEQPGWMSKWSPYSADVGAEVVYRVALGESVRDICREDGKPTEKTVYAWAANNPSFGEALARARVTSADRLAEQTRDIADDDATGRSHEAVGHARLRIETRKWLASKYKPQAYGDKLDVSGDLQISIVVQRFTDALTAPDATVIEGTAKRE